SMLHRKSMKTATKNQSPHVEASALLTNRGGLTPSLVYTLHTPSCLCVVPDIARLSGLLSSQHLF
ncbi:hypothetical protein, partial [Salmonella enterica]|uniref:hypothetical protein n=1 Tax=Salmonella enterica TaxID=28901 RepID=UPI0020C434BD